METDEATAKDFARDGYVVLPEVMPAALRTQMIADAARRRFAPPHPKAGGAFAMAAMRGGGGAGPGVRWLREAVRRAGLAVLDANEASYQRYEVDGNGLPPHRDQRYYASSIVIATLLGSATFAIHGSSRPEDIVAEWTTEAGQVIILRGWTPHLSEDPRPYHRVDPPLRGPRLMFQLRHNLAATNDGPSGLSMLTAAEVEQATGLAAAMRRADAAAAGTLL